MYYMKRGAIYYGSKKFLALGRVKNCMRELTAYGIARKAEIGSENVYDFSLGCPSAPIPESVNQAILASLSGYGS